MSYYFGARVNAYLLVVNVKGVEVSYGLCDAAHRKSEKVSR